MVEFDEPLNEDALFRQKKKNGKKKSFRIVPFLQPALEGSVADTHAHLDMLSNVDLVLARCAVHKLEFICCMTDPVNNPAQSYDNLELWREKAAALLPRVVAHTQSQVEDEIKPGNIPHLRISIGCHPHNAKEFTPEVEQAMIERLKDPRTCALGEVGLDYHYDHSPRDIQREVFRKQIRIAHQAGLPLILHLREAHDDALKIMDEESFPAAGVLLHCFNLDYETLKPWLERDCYVAFGGPLTFKKNEATQIAAAHTPHIRILSETDAPFMTPEPMRGMTCEPEHAIFTAAKLAEVCGFKPGEARKHFLNKIYQNALALLNRQPSEWQRSAMHVKEGQR